MAKKEKIEKKESYELIITEKPQAAMKIAYALSEDIPEKQMTGGVPYYRLKYKDKDIVIACAVGHIFSLHSEERGWPIFNVEWIPNYKLKNDYTKKYYSVISQLSKNASRFTIATDYDIEGELIGFNILRFICRQKDAARMKFSTLTKPDIVSAYNAPMPSIDFGLAKSGETRHILDWYYGINLSRALMNCLSKAGKFVVMSVGRVQGPALSFIVEKEKEILAFKPKPYWQIFLTVSNSHKIEVKYEKDITKRVELAKFYHLRDKTAEARTEKSEQRVTPPLPFDLTTLQTEAYRLLKITPSRLLQIAQQLYLAGLISYPRTSSQKLPPTIGYKKIIEELAKSTQLVKYITRDVPAEGKKQDAHPAIFPTGEIAKLNEEEKKVYDLIVKRFISCFCADAVIESKRVIVTVDSLIFYIQGLEIKEKGWTVVYKSNLEEKKIPDMNGRVLIKEIRIEEKLTQPPRRYTQASLVAELTRKNLGTKATRAMIVDTLYKRGYALGESIHATPFGIGLIDTLKEYSKIILDEKLTRHFEEEIGKVEKSRDKDAIQKKILDEAKKVIGDIATEFKEKSSEIGKKLLIGYKEMRGEEKEAGKIMQCPKCKEGFLVMRRSKEGKQFLACDKYPDCKTTFSLPQFSLIKKTEKTCECGFPLLLSIRKGRRPWEFCFNPNCPKRQNNNSNKT